MHLSFAGRQRNVDLLLQPFEDLDVSRHARLLNEQQVVWFQSRRQLDECGRRHGGMGVEHDSPREPDFLAGRLDRRHHPVDVGRRSRVLVDSVRRHLLGLRCVIDADSIARWAAKQPVHGRVPQLARDVPQGNVDRRHRMDHDRAAADVAMGPEHLLPEVLDARRVLAAQQIEQGMGQLASHADVRPLQVSPTRDAVIRLDLHIHDRANPICLQPGDANARRAVHHLSPRRVLRRNRLIEQCQASGRTPHSSKQVATIEMPCL